MSVFLCCSQRDILSTYTVQGTYIWTSAVFDFCSASASSLFRSSLCMQPSVEWIPNFHYSGIFGLMKLLLPEILPQVVDKVG